MKKFLVICNSDVDKALVGEYLKAGGSILEIVKLLDAIDKKNLNDVSTIFSAVATVILE